MGDLFRVNAVILIFSPMNGLHVESMGQDKLDPRFVAGVRQPIPAEDAFAADRQIVAVGPHQLEEILEIVVFDGWYGPAFYPSDPSRKCTSAVSVDRFRS